MPDLEANRRQWDGEYTWSGGGDEWSMAWGSPDAQWHSTLRPRLRRFLPAATILEIAPGYGRWTQYLVGECERFVGVDLSARCIDACRDRFADSPHAEFLVGDGKSLEGVADASVDLAFSFDALVHVEEDVIDAYLRELARTLTPDGVAFVHHSNLAACRPAPGAARLALRLAERRSGKSTGGFDRWRGTTMSAERFAELAARAGLVPIGQELVNWLGGRLIDCISLVTPAGSRWQRPNAVVPNPYFMAEAASSARASLVHGETASAADWLRENRSNQQLGPLARTLSVSLGPWGVTLVGPWPRVHRRQPVAPE